MSMEQVALLMFVITLVSLLLGLQVAFALGGSALICGLIVFGPGIVYQFAIATWGVMMMYSLLAVPLFVFMGSILSSAGIASRLYESMHIILGGLKGGLCITTLVICIFFGACTGVIGAAVITMGLIALPGMLKRGYDQGMACGSVAAGGCLGMVIPPSLMYILYGCESGVSIASLFIAGIVPGVLLGLAYALYVAIRCIVRPSDGPPISPEERAKYSGRQVAALLARSILPFFVLIVLVLGSIMFGFAAPSEAASLGCVGALGIAAAYRKLTVAVLKDAGVTTVKVTTMVVFIILGAKYFTAVFFALGAPASVASFVNSLGLSGDVLLLLVLGVLFILGFFMDWIALMMVFVPIFNPIILGLGYNPLWYGMVFCMVMCVSLLTPPFAYALFYLKGIAPPEISFGTMCRGVAPYVTIHTLQVIVLYFFPSLTLWLPTLAGLK